MSDPNVAMLTQLAEVQGQLKAMTTMLMHNSQATNQRLDDMRGSMETRFDGMDKRIDGVDTRIAVLEKNERDTALRTAGIASISAAAVSAVMVAGAHLLRIKGGG
ncbi:MAG: hypothetical protein K2W93_14130 [Burkholderiaceae bacterium]|nr:hypothetical protein [Burkholderiaceae bacterium]